MRLIIGPATTSQRQIMQSKVQTVIDLRLTAFDPETLLPLSGAQPVRCTLSELRADSIEDTELLRGLLAIEHDDRVAFLRSYSGWVLYHGICLPIQFRS